MIVWTTYGVEPTAKVRQTQSDKWKQRPCVMRYRAFADKCRARGMTIQDGDHIVFCIPMPKSWSKAKFAEMLGQPHRQRIDLDNAVGGLMDAVMPEGDSHLSSLGSIKKIWHVTGQIKIGREQ